MRILVVDDSEDSRDLTEGALLSANYDDIVSVESGEKALRMLGVGSVVTDMPAIDVMLLDVVMPEMDGIETCARIRNDARYADLPIIMVTSRDDMESLSNAFVAGANDYITKPVNRIELVARVRAALKLKQELDRRRARELELLNVLSGCGDRRSLPWIDEATGMLAGEAAEAYLSASTERESNTPISVLALALDRFDSYREVYGEPAARGVLADVSKAVCRLGASVGIVAGAYPNGTIVLVAPGLGAGAARELGDALRNAVAGLRVPHSEAIAADHVTASVVAVTGEAERSPERVRLLTHAISRMQDAVASGGDRLLALDL